MATRWRLTATTTDPAVLPAVQSYTHALTDIRQLLTSDSSTLAGTTLAPDAADHLVAGDTGFVQFVSAPIGTNVFTAGDAFKYAIQCQEAHANNNLFLQVWIGVYSNDGSTLLATLRSKTADDVEAATSSTNRTFSGTFSGSYTANGGERIVIELSLTGTPGPAASGVQGHNGQIRFGGSGASGDLPEDDADTSTTKNPWLEFTNTVNFNSTASPGVVSCSASVPTPTATGSATASPGVISCSASVPGPTATGSSSTTPSAVACTASTPTPTASGSATATAGPVSVATTVLAPTATGSANAAPGASQAIASTPDPDAFVAVTAEPDAIQANATIPTPDVLVDGTATPDPVEVVASLPTPDVFASVTASPDPILVTVAVPKPHVFTFFRDIELEVGEMFVRWETLPSRTRWDVSDPRIGWKALPARAIIE